MKPNRFVNADYLERIEAEAEAGKQLAKACHRLFSEAPDLDAKFKAVLAALEAWDELTEGR